VANTLEATIVVLQEADVPHAQEGTRGTELLPAHVSDCSTCCNAGVADLSGLPAGGRGHHDVRAASGVAGEGATGTERLIIWVREHPEHPR
jgi:hypothetical protein